MITNKTGDLLSVTDGIIVHGCNAQGVMGSGVAKLVRDRYPGAYDTYKKYHDHFISRGKKSIPLGVNIYYNAGAVTIINAITQEFYGRDPNMVYVDYNAVKDCFDDLNEHLNGRNITTTVNFPLIGCGLANGDWSIVSEIIDTSISDRHEKILWTL